MTFGAYGAINLLSIGDRSCSVTTSTLDRQLSYDHWGKLVASSESVPQRLRYNGYWYDQELG